MRLEDYLQEQLNIPAEEANKIMNVFKEYKKQYGHGHHHEGSGHHLHFEKNETKDYGEYDFDKVNCDGCHNNCALSEPKCGCGIAMREEILKSNNN